MLKFRDMTKKAYETYREQSIKHYGLELELSGLVPEGHGQKTAMGQYDDMFPKGIKTPGFYFYKILNEHEEEVGLLLYGQRSQKEAFIVDVQIYDHHQRKGYGKMALQMIENEAKRKGFTRISLHVFGHNQQARKLYEKIGYEPTSIQMSKVLL